MKKIGLLWQKQPKKVGFYPLNAASVAGKNREQRGK
jgi:hypothetical protein